MARSRASKRKAALALGAALFALLASGAGAAAHEVGLSRGDYALDGPALSAQLTFARREVIGLVAGLDADRDGAIEAAEIERSRDEIERAIVGRVQVRGDSGPCPGTLESASLAEEDGFTLHARYHCPAPLREATVELNLLDDLPVGHRHLARVMAHGGPSDMLLSQRSRSFTLAAPAQPTPASRHPLGALAFFLLGVEHILKGYDHLAFLLGIVLIGGRARSLFRVITAFTVAHSITLALAVLGIWAPSPRIVEPAIALSIAYVGVENIFFTPSPEKRARVAFPFGLVHGFGFAGALQEIAMPRGEIPLALLLFNLGVEAGQLAALAVLLPLVLYARRSASFRDLGVRVMSAFILAMGLIWFGQRAFGG